MGRFKTGIYIIAASVLVFSEAQSTELQWTRGIETGIEYVTDKTSIGELENSSSERRAVVTPFIGVSGSGRRTAFTLDASLVAKASSESDESEINPRLAATSSVSTYQNQLRFESAAQVQQRTVNSPFLENETLVEDTATEQVVSLLAGPRYEKRYGSTAIDASYTVGTTASSETEDSRSVVQAASAQVLHLLPDEQWLAGARMDAQHTAFDAAPSAFSQIYRVFAGYEFHRNLTGRVTVGRELIDVDDEITDTHSLWGVGVNWRIGKRIEVDAAYVERLFGRQPIVSVAVIGRRSSVELSWTRRLGLSSIADSIEFGIENLPDVESALNSDAEAGQSAVPAAESNPDLPGGSLLPLFQESRTVNENLTLTYSLRGRVSVLSASISRVEQEDLIRADSSASTLLEANLTRQLTRASSATVRAAVGESEQFGDVREITTDGSFTRLGVTWNFEF